MVAYILPNNSTADVLATEASLRSVMVNFVNVYIPLLKLLSRNYANSSPRATPHHLMRGGPSQLSSPSRCDMVHPYLPRVGTWTTSLLPLQWHEICQDPLPNSCSLVEIVFWLILDDTGRHHISRGYIRDYCGPLQSFDHSSLRETSCTQTRPAIQLLAWNIQRQRIFPKWTQPNNCALGPLGQPSPSSDLVTVHHSSFIVTLVGCADDPSYINCHVANHMVAYLFTCPSHP